MKELLKRIKNLLINKKNPPNRGINKNYEFIKKAMIVKFIS